MKFALYVEGYTERALSLFMKRWLDSKLSHRIEVKPVRFKGCGDYLSNFAQRAKRDLDSGRVIAVIGLLDLYGAALRFPHNSSIDAKYNWAKAELERQVEHSRFRQHFAVHETEAWLLSDPSIFPAAIRPRMEKFADRPESVDFQDPPAKLLRHLYAAAGRDYMKVTDGAALFGKLNPEVACARCPHLNLLLSDMLVLATAA